MNEQLHKPKYQIDFFMDLICEWCYLGYFVLNTLSDKYDFSINYRLMEIHPDAPKQGMPMSYHLHFPERFYKQLDTLGAPYGLRFNHKDIFANTHDALLISQYALDKGKGPGLLHYLWDEYMLKGINISNREFLEEAALKFGISPRDAELAFSDLKTQAPLAYNLHMNEQGPAQGQVPAFIVNGSYFMIGAQSADTWEELFAKLAAESGQ